MSNDVQHLAGQHRYVFRRDGDEIGLADYWLRGNEIHLTHTEINPKLRGKGLGAQMVHEVLEKIRVETGYRVVADCPFVADWLDKHPEYMELAERGR